MARHLELQKLSQQGKDQCLPLAALEVRGVPRVTPQPKLLRQRILEAAVESFDCAVCLRMISSCLEIREIYHYKIKNMTNLIKLNHIYLNSTFHKSRAQMLTYISHVHTN
jgi:hypothetical protein